MYYNIINTTCDVIIRYQIFDVNNYTRYDLSIYDATLLRGDGTTYYDNVTPIRRLYEFRYNE